MPSRPGAYPFIACIPKTLPKKEWLPAAETAFANNPTNRVPTARLTRVARSFKPTPLSLSIIRHSFWGHDGITLTVSFMDNPQAELRKRILSHMNAWSKTANVKFVASNTDPVVRVARQGGPNGGYWCYVGTDLMHIARHRATMNLEAFTMSTTEAEFHRVVRHEAGHALGFPHEHMRRQLVKLIDPQKAFAYFLREDGWGEREVRDQVLTPIEDRSILGTPPDVRSIMCYQIPGSITKTGRPIVGGLDIDRTDYAFAKSMYPKTGTPPPPKRPRRRRKRR